MPPPANAETAARRLATNQLTSATTMVTAPCQSTTVKATRRACAASIETTVICPSGIKKATFLTLGEWGSGFALLFAVQPLRWSGAKPRDYRDGRFEIPHREGSRG